VPAGFFHPPHGCGPVWNVAGLSQRRHPRLAARLAGRPDDLVYKGLHSRLQGRRLPVESP